MFKKTFEKNWIFFPIDIMKKYSLEIAFYAEKKTKKKAFS